MNSFGKMVVSVNTFFSESFSLFKNFGNLKIAFRRKLMAIVFILMIILLPVIFVLGIVLK